MDSPLRSDVRWTLSLAKLGYLNKNMVNLHASTRACNDCCALHPVESRMRSCNSLTYMLSDQRVESRDDLPRRWEEHHRNFQQCGVHVCTIPTDIVKPLRTLKIIAFTEAGSGFFQ